MDDISKILLAFFGGIITLAIVSSIVGQKSQAPAAISAFGGAISKVVAAAVNPVSAHYGYGNGESSTASPGVSFNSNPLPNLSAVFMGAVPGGFK